MASYAAAGVDIEAGDRAVELMKEWVRRTRRPEVVGGLGGFAGLFDASALKRYERPLLASATDGVGTKVDLAQALGMYDTIGHDLVGMVVDDLVVCGAEPLFMTDYICVGKVVPERVAAIVKGIAEGCVWPAAPWSAARRPSTPGLLGPDDFDLAGAGTGVVEADRLLGADRVRTGDVVIAMASSGLHSNGYSLVRHVLEPAGLVAGRARSTSSAGRSARSCWSPPGSTRWTAWRWPAPPRCTPSPHHRRRPRGQPGPGRSRRAARRVDRSPGPRPPIFEVLAGHGRRRAGGAGEDPQHGRRHGRRRPRGVGGRGARACWPTAVCRPGCRRDRPRRPARADRSRLT